MAVQCLYAASIWHNAVPREFRTSIARSQLSVVKTLPKLQVYNNLSKLLGSVRNPGFRGCSRISARASYSRRRSPTSSTYPELSQRLQLATPNDLESCCLPILHIFLALQTTGASWHLATPPALDLDGPFFSPPASTHSLSPRLTFNCFTSTQSDQ